MDRNPKISVAVPVYDMLNGLNFLKQSLDMLAKQTFKDFEVVISDDSITEDIRKFCDKYNNSLAIRYIKNLTPPGMASNTNNAMLYSNGELIKILYQDDRLAHRKALEEIVNNFDDKDIWLATACTHTDGHIHVPHYSMGIRKGINTIGSPSVITVRKMDNPILFDNKLTWVLDCKYYVEMHKKYGPPVILNDVNVVIGTGSHQTTFNLSQARKQAEVNFLSEKYENFI